MSADSLDNFDYQKASEHVAKNAREHYWAVAMGLQEVDGLSVSPYLRQLSTSYISGEKTLAETGQLIRAYHAADISHNTVDENNCPNKENQRDANHLEADLVSQRIAELLERAVFYLAPEMFTSIHAYLFQDLDESTYHPGQFKTERMIKQEEILNGDSVLYADPLTYKMSLQGAFAAEQAKSYTAFNKDELKSFCHTIAFLWQIHPFFEGNTRTVAVFSELYLNYLGFNIANEPFEKHAQFFRDALVRAMYRNAVAEIFPDSSFLIAFYENVLGLKKNELLRENLVCSALFDNPSLLRNVNPSEALRK